MSLTLKMVYGCLTGAWGGFIAWVLLDLLLGVQPANPFLDALINGAIIGVCIGTLMGGFGGLVEWQLKKLARGLGNGLVMGLLGGVIGLLVGETFFQVFGQATLVRAIGWAIFGVAIGAGEGVLNRSWRRLLFGMIGGFTGGILGSLALVLAKNSLAMPGFSRALGFTILGALIGLFVGLAWMVVRTFVGTLKVISAGRNEGKEVLLDKDTIYIGRDDACDLGLYGDKSIQPRHAGIRREKHGYVIQPIGAFPVQVNGQPVQSHLLQKGDRIGVGREVIVFQ
jgi:hypothetical protein